MKTVYFPFTAINPTKAEQLAAVWGPLTLLQPSTETYLPETRSLEEAGWIEPLFPNTDHPQRLIDLMNAFEQWAEGHSGSDLAALMKQGAPVPFFGDQSFAQIVTALRRGGKTAGPSLSDTTSSQDIFQDQLLLAMAQKFDRQQDELAREIDALSQQERHMLAQLKGEDDLDGAPSSAPWSPPADRRDAMLDLRLKAWARVMAAVEGMGNGFLGIAMDTLFLTASPDVMAQIEERFPEAHRRLAACALPAERLPSEISGILPSWLAAPLTSQDASIPLLNGEASPRLDLIEIPGVPVERFLQRLAGDPQRGTADPMTRHCAESCWVGSVAWPEDTARRFD
jgi:hypothetical protein